MSDVLELQGESARVRRLARAVMDGTVSFDDYRASRARIIAALLDQQVSPQTDLGLPGLVEPRAAVGDADGETRSDADTLPGAGLDDAPGAARGEAAAAALEEVFESEPPSRLWLGLGLLGVLAFGSFLALTLLLS